MSKGDDSPGKGRSPKAGRVGAVSRWAHSVGTAGDGARRRPFWRGLVELEAEAEKALDGLVRERFLGVASEVIREQLELPALGDGRPDASELTDERLGARLPKLAFRLYGLYLETLGDVLEEYLGAQLGAGPGKRPRRSEWQVGELNLVPEDYASHARAAEDVHQMLVGLERPSECGQEGAVSVAEAVRWALTDGMGDTARAMLGSEYDPGSEAESVDVEVVLESWLLDGRVFDGLVRVAGTLESVMDRVEDALHSKRQAATEAGKEADSDGDSGQEIISLEGVRERLRALGHPPESSGEGGSGAMVVKSLVEALLGGLELPKLELMLPVKGGGKGVRVGRGSLGGSKTAGRPGQKGAGPTVSSQPDLPGFLSRLYGPDSTGDDDTGVDEDD